MSEEKSHFWVAYLEHGKSIEIGREILCKPILYSEALEEAEKYGIVRELKPIGLEDTEF